MLNPMEYKWKNERKGHGILIIVDDKVGLKGEEEIETRIMHDSNLSPMFKTRGYTISFFFFFLQ